MKRLRLQQGWLYRYRDFSLMNEIKIRRRFAFVRTISEIVYYCIGTYRISYTRIPRLKSTCLHHLRFARHSISPKFPYNYYSF